MKRIIIALAATAALAIAVPVAATTATAATVPAPLASVTPITPVPTTSSLPYVPWYAFSCATGTIGALTVADGRALLAVSATPCTPAATKFTFGVVTFRYLGSAIATPDNLGPYASSGPSELTAYLDFNSLMTGPTVDVCVMRSAYVRLACVSVEVGVTGPVAVTPIGVDDPLVNRPVEYNGYLIPMPPDPACATCVHLTS
jgi:hypothetical protein